MIFPHGDLCINREFYKHGTVLVYTTPADPKFMQLWSPRNVPAEWMFPQPQKNQAYFNCGLSYTGITSHDKHRKVTNKASKHSLAIRAGSYIKRLCKPIHVPVYCILGTVVMTWLF